MHTRKMILYVSTVVIFFIVVLFWILLLNIQKANETNVPREGILSPFDGIKETFTKMFENISTSNIPAISPAREKLTPESFNSFGESPKTLQASTTIKAEEANDTRGY
ncbi:MAG: hypothetical protein Q7S11_02855 [bacterium]|nr:hypothetical protein [bacterium]